MKTFLLLFLMLLCNVCFGCASTGYYTKINGQEYPGEIEQCINECRGFVEYYAPSRPPPDIYIPPRTPPGVAIGALLVGGIVHAGMEQNRREYVFRECMKYRGFMWIETTKGTQE